MRTTSADTPDRRRSRPRTWRLPATTATSRQRRHRGAGRQPHLGVGPAPTEPDIDRDRLRLGPRRLAAQARDRRSRRLRTDPTSAPAGRPGTGCSGPVGLDPTAAGSEGGGHTGGGHTGGPPDSSSSGQSSSAPVGPDGWTAITPARRLAFRPHPGRGSGGGDGSAAARLKSVRNDIRTRPSGQPQAEESGLPQVGHSAGPTVPASIASISTDRPKA